MSGPSGAAPLPWDDALIAAALLAVDPEGLGGIHVRGRAGPVRDRWLDCVAEAVGPEAPFRRIAAGISEARLTGGLDIGATLDAGRPVLERGVLAAVHGGFLVLAMAERLAPAAAGIIGTAIDRRAVQIERDGISATQPAGFALVALDEGVDADEALAPALADRLGLRLDLHAIGWRDTDRSVVPLAAGAARARLPFVVMADDMLDALCAVALSSGNSSLRASIHLVRAARAAAALAGRTMVTVEDAATALRLVLGMRLSEAAPPPEEAEAEPAPREQEPASAANENERTTASTEMPEDMQIAASEAVLPRHLLAGLEAGPLRRGARRSAGIAGAARSKGRRGRAIGTAPTPPTPGARLDVLATLRRAAPWQRVRAREAGVDAAGPTTRLLIRKDDFRYVRYREKTGTTAIFVVDASGSAALERLSETKGAIELLLAECYVRRDSVALIAFRGMSAETLLEPTRSLVRAKRCLSALPGGGGTPLANGILAALALSEASVNKGQSVVTVFLTDGRGNIGLGGVAGREAASADASRSALLFRGAGHRSLVIDTAKRPQARAATLAGELGAEYLPLPRGGSSALAREIGARMEG